MGLLATIALQLVVVHLVDGRAVAINPAQMTHMSEARRDVDEAKQLADNVRCVIFFSDGSYLSTAEECIDIVNKGTNNREPRE